MTELLDRQHGLQSGEDSVGQFLSEIRQIPRLTVEEERALARRCAEGDEDAIRQMVNSNLRLVVSVAKEYAGRSVPLLDLIQEGSIGLLAAARNFDCSRELRFSTYATKGIRRGIVRYLIAHSGSIRIPEHTAEAMHKVRAAQGVLRLEVGQEPTVAQIAEKTGIPVEKVEELMLLDPEVCSLDIAVGDEDGSTLGSLIQDEQTAQPHEKLVRRELEGVLNTLLGMLEDRQRQILMLHFGLEDGVCRSLEAIGKQLGISKERTRQIERSAMEKLQKMGASMGLEDFLE